MIIEEYIDAQNIIVKFDNGYKIQSAMKEFNNGSISNPYDKTIHGVGYIGEGKYICSKDKVFTKPYRHWDSMFERCYSNKFNNRKVTYKECSVDSEWHNFQNFGAWFDENYYEVNDEVMCLDKYRLFKNNKIYSKNTCIFVPQFRNTLFCKRQNDRGEYPIGVNYQSKIDKYQARCSTLEGRVYLGVYSTPEEAYYVYKHFKENYIKQKAEEYKNKIPIKLYDALYRYEVEITD